MKLFKRIMAAAAAGVMALAVFTGCSSGNSGSYTINGTLSMRSNGQEVVAGAPITIVSDGSATYLSYEVEGNTVEGLTIGTDYYERVYPTSSSGAKWTKSTVEAAAAASEAELKTGTITIDGTEYQTQTYDEVSYYCLEDGLLKYLYLKEGTEETFIRIDSVSNEIDSSLLAAPAASEIEAAA